MTEIQWLPIREVHPYEKNPRFNDDSVEAVANSIRAFGFRAPIILDKDHVIIAGHTRLKAAKKLRPSDVIHANKPARNAEHPTMKPVTLMARMIYNSSRPRDRVLDLFGGSGSTLMACEQLHRRCAIMEYDPVYCDVIIKRWQDSTGRTAERIA